MTSNLYKANQIYNSLVGYLPHKRIYLFPSDDLMKSEAYSSGKDFMASRVFALNEIVHDRVDILIVNISALMKKYPCKSLLLSNTISFKVGQTYDFKSLKETFAAMGYINVSKIDQTFQFSVRGDIIDVFSLNYDNPIRLEFFDDELVSIRTFDIATQTSIKELKKAECLPASDFLLEKDKLDHLDSVLLPYIEKSKVFDDKFDNDRLELLTSNDLDDIKNGNITYRSYFYYSLLEPNCVTLFDLLENYTFIYASFDSIKESQNLLLLESDEFIHSLKEEGALIKDADFYIDVSKFFAFNDNILTYDFSTSGKDYVFDFASVDIQFSRIEDIPFVLKTYLSEGYKIVLSIANKSELKLIEKLFTDTSLSYQEVFNFDLPDQDKIGIQVYDMPNGFISRSKKILYLASKEIFNSKRSNSKYISRYKEGSIIRSYEDLEPGDYVVHEYQGIARFEGLVTLEVDNKHQDYLKLLFKNNEIYYVPLSQFQVVRKYVGKEGYKPALSSLHGESWQKKKEAIKKRVNDLADRLVNLNISRSMIKGFQFEKDDDIQKQFESDFPYQLTPDQERTLKEVKDDMESDVVMDRIICGDVGFGKTEIAFRAAFKAILSGKQVCLMCPTTLLARQHFERAVERFAPYGVHLCLLSRLNTERTNDKNIELINQGKIDFVIGTHKVLSKKLKFPNLGLLIIDEEQRFGVEQKEKIKELRNQVDVLTLSATPIPRTLQIALLGVRQLSQIQTPPKDRMPIQTFVMPYKEEIVKELIERELSRGGQVFFLHNNTETIYNVARRLQELIPNAKFAISHGHMDKNDIEDVMEKFYNGEIDVLVSTSIIENGIDIPNANMIIVQDADHYGLSQLYQIKGRVGRSDKISYAYLMYNEYKVLNENARKRLKTLQEFTALGSGYKIAQRDLMIRGAGDILGPEQAGFIDSIGLDMYLEILNDTIKEKLGEPVSGKKEEVIPYLTMDAYIPDSYAPETDKIELYQEIQSAINKEQLDIIKAKIEDIYGKMPVNVEYLLLKREIDILANDAHLASLNEGENTIEIVLGHDYINIDKVGTLLFEALIPYLSFVSMNYAKEEFHISLTKNKTWINDLMGILKALIKVYNIEGNITA
ncbi:MAG: transcription-repair coupling factor [Coprobacillus sp.]|nr:transcription-repair coupling factor [Coprobacillus sp.]